MTIREKQRLGEMYEAVDDPQLMRELQQCSERIFEINQMHPSRRVERNERIRKLLAKTGEHFNVNAPFYCDFGYNIEVGDYFFANYNLTILDENLVTFGDHVYIGPNCSFFTASHPLDAELRNANYQYAHPIHVGNNVWFGGNVTVLPGVTIGNNVTVGAGAVVTRDVPDNVVVAGNPARIIKALAQE